MHNNTHCSIFLSLKQLKYPLVKDWLNKLWDIYTVGYILCGYLKMGQLYRYECRPNIINRKKARARKLKIIY